MKDAGKDTLFKMRRMRNNNRWCYEKIRPYLGEKVLELGSGIGNISRHMVADGKNLIMTDINAEYTGYLSGRFGSIPSVRVINMDVKDLDMALKADERPDTVVAINILEHIEDDLETVFAVVIRIGNLRVADIGREFQEHVQPVFFPRRAEAGEIAVVVGIHGENVIEAVEVLGFDLPGALAGQVDAAVQGGGLGAAIGRTADVPAADAGGIGLDLTGQAFAFDQTPEDAFGGGRTADVAEADKQNFYQGPFSAGCISGRRRITWA